MNILFISREGQSLGLALRCQEEGFPTSFYVEEREAAFVGNGIVTKPLFNKQLLCQNGDYILSSLNQLVADVKPDLIIVEGKGMGRISDYLREEKYNVFGGSYWSDTLSSSLSYGREVMKRVGIKEWKGEEGVRVEVGVWWNGMQMLSNYMVWNEERFMNDSLGCKIDSSSHITKVIGSDSYMVREGIGRVEKLLKKSRFRGILSLSCIVSEKQIYGVVFQSSFTFLPSLLELYKGSVTQLLLGVASMQKMEGMFSGDISLSLLLSIPPFPTPHTGTSMEVQGINKYNLPHLYLNDMMKEGEEWYSGGRDGKLCMVCARGREIGECKKRVMKTISNLNIEDVQYRTDFTTRFLKQQKSV